MFMNNRFLDKLSVRTGLSHKELNSLIEDSKNEFVRRDVEINGKRRTFYIPSPTLKFIQYQVMSIILNKISVSESAHAYTKGKSIKSNVLAHANSKHFYQTDIVSFFPNIKTQMVKESLLQNWPLKNDSKIEDIELTLKITCPFGHLDLGSPTSPILSNIVMKNFDYDLLSQLRKDNYKIIYTRYSDDITISSESRLSRNIEYTVHNLLLKYGFKKNNKKTKIVELKEFIKITGIYLYADGKITVGTKFKKNLKHYLYLLINENKSKKTKEQILGMLSFLRDIEPDYYQKMVLKYSINHSNLIAFLKDN